MSESKKHTTSRRDFLSKTGRIAAASTLLSGVAIPKVYAGEDNTIQTNIKAKIEAANERFMGAFNGGDWAALAALYTVDATLLPPNAPNVQGRQAIGFFWRSAAEAGVHDLAIIAGKVEQNGEKVYEVGRYTLRVRVSETQVVDDKGKYVVIWKQEEGQWHLHVDIWNSDLAAS